jgi:hypothetical protein
MIKVPIVINTEDVKSDSEWIASGLNVFKSEITIFVGTHSKDILKLSEDVSDFNGIKKEELKNYNESENNAKIYGMSNLMNHGQDIYFFTNATRLIGGIKQNGLLPEIFDFLTHEMTHATRLMICKEIFKRNGIHDNFHKQIIWPAINDSNSADSINEQTFAFILGISIRNILPFWLGLVAKHIPEIKKLF